MYNTPIALQHTYHPAPGNPTHRPLLPTDDLDRFDTVSARLGNRCKPRSTASQRKIKPYFSDTGESIPNEPVSTHQEVHLLLEVVTTFNEEDHTPARDKEHSTRSQIAGSEPNLTCTEAPIDRKEQTMDRARHAVSLILIAVLMGFLAPRATLAQASRTVYVDDNGTPIPASRGACGKPNYASIQAAVNDTSATRVVVCKGIYTELIRVERSLTLEGRSGAVLQAPTVPNFSIAIVSFTGVQQSRLKGFTITDDNTTDTQVFAEVDVRDAAQVTISHNHFRARRPVILVSVGQADITDNIIEWSSGEAINASSPNTFVMIDDNTFRSQGPQEGLIGIDIREGASGDVEDNMITGNNGELSAGIIVDLTDQVSIRDNTVTHNALGIVLGDETGAVEVRSNLIRNNTSHGIFLTDASFNTVVENESDHNGGSGIWVETAPSDPNAFQNVIRTNKVHDNRGDGIHLGRGVRGTIVKENKVTHNSGVDIVDDNGLPLVNIYTDNTCGTSNPTGLCDE